MSRVVEVRSPAQVQRGGRGRRDLLVGCVGILAQLVFVAGWLTAQTWQPAGYSPVRDTISDLMAQTAPHAWVPITALMVAGAGTGVFALAGLRPALRAAGRTGAYAPWMLALSALALGNLLSFLQIPCQSGVACSSHQAMSTFGGIQDVVGGVIVVLLLAVTPFPMARRMSAVSGWERLARPSLLVGVVLLGCYVSMGLGATTAVHGLLERVIATVGAGWTAVLAANLIRVGRSAELTKSPPS